VFLLVPAIATAIPTDEDPFPDPNDKPAVKAASPGEKLIAAAKETIEADPEYPATPEAVEFALWCYAESGDAKDLEVAESFLGRLPDRDGPETEGRFRSFLQVAWARGEVEGIAAREDLMASASPMARMQAALLGAVKRDDDTGIKKALAGLQQELERFRTEYEPHEGNPLQMVPFPDRFLDYLQAGTLAAEVSGSKDLLNDLLTLAQDPVNNFFLRRRSTMHIRDGFRGARMLWTLGTMAGDADLREFAEGILAERLPEATRAYFRKDRGIGNPELVPAAALAVARIERHPVQMVLLGDPEDPTLTALRRACVALFEPRKILINLDPARDAERIETLMYPAELAPALFVCVESVCSAPITDPAKVEATVKEILAATRGQEP
jgi:hypothetical protein